MDHGMPTELPVIAVEGELCQWVVKDALAVQSLEDVHLELVIAAVERNLPFYNQQGKFVCNILVTSAMGVAARYEQVRRKCGKAAQQEDMEAALAEKDADEEEGDKVVSMRGRRRK